MLAHPMMTMTKERASRNEYSPVCIDRSWRKDKATPKEDRICH